MDVFLTRTSCLDLLYTTQFEGQTVQVAGQPYFDLGTPRLSLAVGYGFSVAGAKTELTVGLGTIRTKTDYDGPTRDDVTWRQWHGGAVTLRFPFGLGIQFEMGRHRLAERYYVLDQDTVVAEFLRWERMTRIGVSMPVTELW